MDCGTWSCGYMPLSVNDVLPFGTAKGGSHGAGAPSIRIPEKESQYRLGV